jgi:hypothetical protein
MRNTPWAVIVLACSSCESVDTTKDVLAENVLYENKSTSTLQAANVQDALDEMALVLAEAIIGTWSITNFGNATNNPGMVTFNPDQSYSVTGDFNAAAIFAGLGPDAASPDGYQVVSNKLMILSSVPPGGPRQSPACAVLDLQSGTVTLLGQGVQASVLARQ